jgi:hypothetical protein
MNDNAIYIKTAAGAEEVRSRSRKLAPRLRTVLIMVDGLLAVRHLQRAVATLGAPADSLQQLEREGLIEARDPVGVEALPDAAEVDLVLPTLPAPERFRAAQKFMNDTAVDALGLRAFFFTLKMERCSTCEDLIALLPEFQKAVGKGSGEDVARVLTARARDLLG